MANTASGSTPRRAGSRATYIKLAVVILVALVVVIVALQNTQATETQLLFWTFTLSRALLLFATGLIGFVLGIITTLYVLRRRRSPGA